MSSQPSNPERSDDESLGDDKELLRRICNTPVWVVTKDGQVRPSSVAFLDNHTNEVSVSVAEQTTSEKELDGLPDFGLMSLTVGVPRNINHIVSKTPELADLAHRVICPPKDLIGNPRKAAARLMAEKAKWLVYPASYRKTGDNADSGN